MHVQFYPSALLDLSGLLLEEAVTIGIEETESGGSKYRLRLHTAI